jgi:hypothetical protein
MKPLVDYTGLREGDIALRVDVKEEYARHRPIEHSLVFLLSTPDKGGRATYFVSWTRRDTGVFEFIKMNDESIGIANLFEIINR